MLWKDRRMCHVLGLVTAGQVLGGCPLPRLCLSPPLLLGAMLPRHEPCAACGGRCCSFTSFPCVLSIVRNDILNLIRFCSQRNWI